MFELIVYLTAMVVVFSSVHWLNVKNVRDVLFILIGALVPIVNIGIAIILVLCYLDSKMVNKGK